MTANVSWTVKPPTILHIEALSADQKSQLFGLVCEDFATSSPIHVALEISPQEYSNYLHDDWESYIHTGPLGSVVAIEPDSGEILGCIITSDFPSCFADVDKKPKKQQIISALLQELEQIYLDKLRLENNGTTEKSLLVDIALVPDRYANQGIYQRLRLRLQELARENGFEKIYGELSSAPTQHVCINKLHQQMVAEVFYKDFCFDGNRPFANILEPASVKLVMASLPAV